MFDKFYNFKEFNSTFLEDYNDESKEIKIYVAVINHRFKFIHIVDILCFNINI